MNSTGMLILLFAAHAIADLGLQNDWLAAAKNPWGDLAKALGSDSWFWAMFGHSMIHAGFVFAVTRSITLACAELVLHFAIDTMKCRGWFGLGPDQLMHYACKIAYWMLLVDYRRIA